VVPRLTGFMASYPDLRLAVDLNDDYVDLVAGNFDVAVRIGTLPDSSLVARRLAPNRRILCASPDYIERHGEPRNIADLHHHRLVAGGPQVTWRLEGPEGPVTFKPQTLLQTNSSEVVREAVISGMGIGFRSTWDVGSELRRGSLRRVMPSYGGSADVAIYAVYSGRRLVPLKVRALVDYLVSIFGPETPYWDREVPAVVASGARTG
jgi:DNA-binding transcriptional LysR family regulator